MNENDGLHISVIPMNEAKSKSQQIDGSMDRYRILDVQKSKSMCNSLVR